MNKILFMYMNSRDVIICYLELRKTRSVFPIPLEFEISKFACMFEMRSCQLCGVKGLNAFQSAVHGIERKT